MRTLESWEEGSEGAVHSLGANIIGWQRWVSQKEIVFVYPQRQSVVAARRRRQFGTARGDLSECGVFPMESGVGDTRCLRSVSGLRDGEQSGTITSGGSKYIKWSKGLF